MLLEKFITGYCRVLDQSRIVQVELEEKKLLDVDCNYEKCVYASQCPIGKEITKLLEE